MTVANAQAPSTDSTKSTELAVSPFESVLDALDFYLCAVLEKIDPDLRVSALHHVESARESLIRAERVATMRPA